MDQEINDAQTKLKYVNKKLKNRVELNKML